MKGSNGLAPADVIKQSTKCPEAPGKRKFHTLIEAEKAAAQSSREWHTTIVPYACSGCGLWHVTGKVRGADVASSNPDGVIVTAAMRTRAFKRTSPTPTLERKDMSEIVAMETPIVGENKAARAKLLAEYLKDKETTSVTEVMEFLGTARYSALAALHEIGWHGMKGQQGWYPPGVDYPSLKGKPIAPLPDGNLVKKKPAKSKKRLTGQALIKQRLRILKPYLADKDAVGTQEIIDLLGGAGREQVRQMMRDQGWVIGHGQNVKWRRPDTAAQTETGDTVDVDEPSQAPIDLAARRHPAGNQLVAASAVAVPITDLGWRPVEGNDKLLGMTIAQMNDMLEAFGLEVRLQIRECR